MQRLPVTASIVLCVASVLAGGARARGAGDDLPPPPPLAAPEGARVLFDGADARAWRCWEPEAEPSGIGDGPAGWRVEDGALVVRPGAGDLVTAELFGDHHLHLDFLVPQEPAQVPDDERGASGVFLAGRYEVQLLDSFQKDTTPRSSGAIFDRFSPRENAARPAGTWQSLDVAWSVEQGAAPRISVWLNDVLVQDDVTLEEPTPGGLPTPIPGAGGASAARFASEPGESSRSIDLGAPAFAVSARFRSEGSGTLVSKCPPEGEWVHDAKALFLRGGRLVYDIGWVGALTSAQNWNDGEWHRVVLLSHDGLARLYVDGELEGEREDFRADDQDHFVFKVGHANTNFGGAYDGEVTDVRFFADGLTPDEAAALSRGAEVAAQAAFDWRPSGELEEEARLRAPIRLQAEGSAVRFANIWVAPLGEVDHAGLIGSWGPESYERGKQIYGGLCVLCHGEDGTKPTNPKARPFALGELQNGFDPLSLFETVTDGYLEMPGNAWLRPDQRYDVIHYLREEFLRERNRSQYFEVTERWLNSLPKGRTRRPEGEQLDLVRRDYGPALAVQLGSEIGAGLAVRLDDQTTLGYDLQTMRSPGAWTGGFVDLGSTHHHQQRGEAIGRPGGEMLAGLDGWGWGFEGALDWDPERRPPRGLLPREWLDYHGHWVNGDRLVLSYAIEGREVLESPSVDRSSGLPVVTHRLTVGPGERPLLLGCVRAPSVGDKLGLVGWWEGPGALVWTVAFVGTGGTRAAVAYRGGARLRWLDDGLRVALEIRPSEDDTELWILRAGGLSSDDVSGFTRFLDNTAERPLPPSPAALLGGGPTRWGEEFVTRGELGAQSPYALDTLTLPETNPWNAWIRTSALDFFEDGRAAVSTYGGDVWIVSGIDADLGELRWKRFAAGLFEPMGLRIVDGLILVTCRDRIVRLHDTDGNGEADFHESFFADPDVTASFHSFNFDLQTDAAGNLYYAKSGQYTDYALPGAVLKVAPDGRSHEVHCTGLRTPNGMGMSPDGRPLVSDNQGNWIPASKISLTREGGFYGVFKSINTNGAGEKTRDDFDRPVLWMPQEFDSSSGGQLFVNDERWGPLAGGYVHTSFGKGWMMRLSIREHGGIAQGAAWKLPFQFAAGIQRARVNPADGQVYAVGLSGWQGPAGGADGCLQRVRFTGEARTLLVEAGVSADGIELIFSAPVERATAEDVGRYAVRRWNYRWARSYGSAFHSLDRPGEQGQDPVAVVAARVSLDGRSVHVELADLRPVDQMEFRFRLRGADGAPVEETVYLTVHHVPPPADAGR
jgi:mono/diheme cytochrome c family protein